MNFHLLFLFTVGIAASLPSPGRFKRAEIGSGSGSGEPLPHDNAQDVVGKISRPRPDRIGRPERPEGRIGRPRGNRHHHEKLSDEIRDAINEYIHEAVAKLSQKHHHHAQEDVVERAGGIVRHSDADKISGRIFNFGGLLGGIPLLGPTLKGAVKTLPVVGGFVGGDDEGIEGRIGGKPGGKPKPSSGGLNLGALLSGLPLVGHTLQGTVKKLPLVGGLVGGDDEVHGRSAAHKETAAGLLGNLDVQNLIKILPLQGVGRTVGNLPLIGETVQKTTGGLPIVGQLVTDSNGQSSLVQLVPLSSVVNLVQSILSVFGGLNLG